MSAEQRKKLESDRLRARGQTGDQSGALAPRRIETESLFLSSSG